MRGRNTRRYIENNNFKRQTQALAILPIGIVILGAALFQVDISITNPLNQVYETVQAALVLFTALAYVLIIFGTVAIFTHTELVTGRDMVDKIMTPLVLEILFAILLFFIGTKT